MASPTSPSSSRLFLFALVLLLSLLSTPTFAQNLTTPTVNGTNATTNATAPSATPAPGDQDSAGTTISSSVALFGALVAAALFSL
ncbi:hypothetical protein BZA05DRAFT_445740 [Tricharina praecox]|uniref:uncharacterized protein n=1 Tax=Tricharina praecox TaxID=43433 RepID=UPI00221EC05D|nr:uncharacterized protein BZA05DRAFT_445740 [Tricharina praecox]KAI5850015.1 hypothetical protein BZA05DRAFT_445740 [Tricharina praecox]